MNEELESTNEELETMNDEMRGIPVQRLRDPIRRVLAGDAVDEIELDGHDRRGKPVQVRIAFAPLQNRPDAEEPDGAILLVSAERSG